MICTSALCSDMVLYVIGAMVGLVMRKAIYCVQQLLKVNIKNMYNDPSYIEATSKHIFALGVFQLASIILIMQSLSLYYTGNTSYFFMGLLTPQVLILANLFKETL